MSWYRIKVVMLALTTVVVIMALTALSLHFQKDRELIEARCGAVKWPVYPVPLFVDRVAAEWLEDLTIAHESWNTQVDADLFLPPVILDETAPNVGIILTAGNFAGESTAHLFYGTGCDLIKVVVTLPSLADRRLWAKFAMHELGHGLGLNHDDNSYSVMHPILTDSSIKRVSDRDKKLLQNLARPFL